MNFFLTDFQPGAVVDKATAKDYETNPIEDYEALRLGIVNAVDFFAKQINNALNVLPIVKRVTR